MTVMAAPPFVVTDDLLIAVGCPFQRRISLGPLTWYGVGGSAEVLAKPKDADQLTVLVRACHEHDVPLRILGKGANLLVCEGIIPGIVVRLDALKDVDIRSEEH